MDGGFWTEVSCNLETSQTLSRIWRPRSAVAGPYPRQSLPGEAAEISAASSRRRMRGVGWLLLR